MTKTGENKSVFSSNRALLSVSVCVYSVFQGVGLGLFRIGECPRQRGGRRDEKT